jgi:hypothetical protein
MHAPHDTQPTFHAWIFFIKMDCIGHGLDPEGKKLSRAKDSLPEFFRAEQKAQYLNILEPSRAKGSISGYAGAELS